MHLMLIGLTGSLDVGSTLDLTLTFAHSDPLTVTLPVQTPADAPMTMGG